MKNHQLTLMWKNSKRVFNNNNNNNNNRCGVKEKKEEGVGVR